MPYVSGLSVLLAEFFEFNSVRTTQMQAAGKIRQQDVAALPFEAENATLASTALWNIYAKGITTKELDTVKPLALWTFPNAAIHSRRSSVGTGQYERS